MVPGLKDPSNIPFRDSKVYIEGFPNSVSAGIPHPSWFFYGIARWDLEPEELRVSYSDENPLVEGP